MPLPLPKADYALAADALFRARKQVGLTQAQLGARIGQSQKFVSVIEMGDRRLDFLELCEFERALGLAPLELAATIYAAVRDKSAP